MQPQAFHCLQVKEELPHLLERCFLQLPLHQHLVVSTKLKYKKNIITSNLGGNFIILIIGWRTCNFSPPFLYARAPSSIAHWPWFKLGLESMTLITLNDLCNSCCLWTLLINKEFLKKTQPWKYYLQEMKALCVWGGGVGAEERKTVQEFTSTALVADFLSSIWVTRPTHTYISAPQSSKKHLVFSSIAFVRAASSSFSWPSLMLHGEHFIIKTKTRPLEEEPPPHSITIKKGPVKYRRHNWS